MRRPDGAAPALAALTLLVVGGALAQVADRARDPVARAAGGAPPLGVVNAVAVDLLWMRADALYDEGRWPEMAAAYEAVGRAAPRLGDSWEYRGFHLAVNLAGEARDTDDRDRWVAEGLRVLEDGVHRNPRSARLRAYLGHLLFERTARWPELRPRLARERDRDPWDEAVTHLAAAAAAEPDDPRTTVWLVDALAARGAEHGAAGRRDAARADFDAARAALDRMVEVLGGNDFAADLQRALDRMQTAAGGD